MKKVFLKELRLINFKGVKDKFIPFSNKTIVSGGNATGKSTIFDAFVWVNFGKDHLDRKDFEITPIEDGVKLGRIDSEVSETLLIDGLETVLRRILHPKWVRRRGTSEEVFDGCETLYYINDVPTSAGEYKKFINSIIDETVFKMITDPAFFLSMKWQDQRENLFQIAGTVSDNEIAASNPDFLALLDMITGKSMSDFKKEIAARKKKLNDDLKLIPSRIDQTKKLMPDTDDFDFISKEIERIDKEISDIDLQISSKYEAQDTLNKVRQEKFEEIRVLELKKKQLIFEEEESNKKWVNECNSYRNELENKLSNLRITLDSEKSNANTYKNLLISYETRIEVINKGLQDLREEWQKENAKTYVESDCLICPIFGNKCSDAFSIEKNESSKELAKQAFLSEREKRLKEINENGVAKKETLESLLKEQKKSTVERDSILSKISDLDKQIIEAEKVLNKNIKRVYSEIIPNNISEYVELENQISEIKNSLADTIQVDVSELKEKKQKLVDVRDCHKLVLGNKALIEKYNLEIKSLEEESRNLSQQIADVEKQEFTINDFNRAKIDECSKRINSLFSIAEFKLFDHTIEGNEFEVCIPTNKKGVPISTTNTADKVNAGLDIINTLCKFHGVTAPIFIDNSESVNSFIDTESQLINLVVTNDKVLTIK
ncbi:MAG: hypothetical protein WCR63_05185 [Bacilli bacterium]